ncbi:MAG: response regulator [Patescibacteria group bacterium]|nr:response regulator [Patescibacteria group bacterium]
MSKQISEQEILNARVLIIEDDVSLLKFYQQRFEADGFKNVDTAMYGEEGIEKIEQQKPDIILLDLILPKMNGFAVLEKIKERKETAQIPVLVTTNLAHDEDKQRAEILKADEYLIKSDYDPDQIVSKVKKYLAEYLGNK